MKRLLLLSLLISTGTAVAAPVYQMFDIPDECPTAACTYSPSLSSTLPPRSLVSEDFNLKKTDEPDYDGFMKSRQVFSSSAERSMELAISFGFLRFLQCILLVEEHNEAQFALQS